MALSASGCVVLAYAAALWELDFEGFEAVMKRRGVDLFELGQEIPVTDGAESGPDACVSSSPGRSRRVSSVS